MKRLPHVDRDVLIESFDHGVARPSSGEPMRITDDGIWVPTPLDVVESAIEALWASSLWDRHQSKGRVTFLDAGMGDGRFVAWLCSLGSSVHACGIESDDSLYELALDNLSRLPTSSVSVCHGSYLDPATYERLGVGASTVDAVLNYPDGNEHALVRFWREHGRPGSHVVFVTPDRSLDFADLELEAEIPIERSFRMYLYRA